MSDLIILSTCNLSLGVDNISPAFFFLFACDYIIGINLCLPDYLPESFYESKNQIIYFVNLQTHFIGDINYNSLKVTLNKWEYSCQCLHAVVTSFTQDTSLIDTWLIDIWTEVSIYMLSNSETSFFFCR